MEQMDEFRQNYTNKMINGQPEELTVGRAFFEKRMFILHKRLILLGKNMGIGPNGSCIPAARRLYVTFDGKFHICERINSTFEIGDIDRGIRLEQVSELMSKFLESTAEACKDCWAARFCTICPAHVAGDGCFPRETKSALCQVVKSNILRDFETYNTILDRNENAFDYMSDVEMI